MTELTVEQSQNAVALAAQQMTQDIAEAHEAMGMIKAFGFVGKLATVATLKKLAEVKEAKNFKGLQYINTEGKLATVATWDEFCIACGVSRRKVDEDLQNLIFFGEDFLETSQRLGLGYREMRKLRKLPEDARAEIIDADYSEATDKEDLIEKIQDLTAKFAQEKKVLEGKLAQSQENYEAQSKVLATKNERINHLDLELAKKTKAIETQTPEQRGGILREEAVAISYKAEAILRGQVWKAFEVLEAHGTECNIDHKQFMSGVLAEYQLILSELKQRFGINDAPTEDDLPEWARSDYQPDETSPLDENVKQILDISDAETVE